MTKKKISAKGKRNRVIAGLLMIGLIVGLVKLFIPSKPNAEVKQTQQTKVKEVKEKSELLENDRVRLDIALLNQMDTPDLYNGCEVTSLAMMLQYNGYPVSKNDVAEKINTVPLIYDNESENDETIYGDPNEGFVGSIAGNGEGYSVYHEPIAKVAKVFVDDKVKVVDLSGKSFDTVLYELKSGNPVWVITTTNFEKPDKLETWQTNNGSVKISWDVHSVVLTGFSPDLIFLNDPYGEKREVDREKFRASWEAMGKQAVTIRPV